MGEVIPFLTAYATALSARAWRTRAQVERHQARLWQRMRPALARYPAFAAVAGDDLSAFPITDIADYRARFGDFTCGLTRADATSLAEAAEGGGLRSGLQAGFSTGTSGGPRGLFVTTAKERALYMGQLLGKVLTPEFLRYRKAVLCLRAPNALYRTPGFDLRFFALDGDLDDITRFAPEVLVAPPQILLKIKPFQALKRVFYGAETLNDIERDLITQRLGVRPDPIYQATEGFLGAPCRLGTLHLNEDSLIIETEPLDDTGRFRPVITDLRRRSQAVVRLRLDDILHDTTCACGSSLRAVKRVEGRIQDIWGWGERCVFPAEVEAVVAPVLPGDHGWTATGDPDGITYSCAYDADVDAVHQALSVFDQALRRVPYDATADYPKRRHVRWAS